MTPHRTWAERALHHARQLADRIGPRGAATPEEKRAADYVEAELRKSGVSDARVDTFKTLRSNWLPLAVVFSAAVWGSVICWGGFYLTHVKAIGGLIGAALCLLALWIVVRHLTFKDHLLRRWLPKSPGVNVLGRICAADETRRQVVLIGSLDTFPAAWIFQTPRRAGFLRLALTVSVASLPVGAVLFVLGAFSIWGLAFILAGACGFLQSLGVLLAIQADQGEYSRGANVNASGIGVLLSLAERLQQQPLHHTTVWLLGCGARTIDSAGLRDFLDRYGASLGSAYFIGFEGVGIGQRLAYVEREGAFRHLIHADVRSLLQRAAHARPDFALQALAATDRSTLTGAAAWRNYRSVCVNVVDERGQLPKWRRENDASAHLQPAALQLAHELGWELLQMLDQDAR
jgi:hypothetical protein